MGVEDFRTLLRAYVALTLARSTGELYGAADALHLYLPAVVNYQNLALHELESLLYKARPDISDAADSSLEEEMYPALLM